MPLKPNSHGKIALYSKDEMRKGIVMPNGSKIKLPSPNLADCVMMSFDNASIISHNLTSSFIPKPIKPMGRR